VTALRVLLGGLLLLWPAALNGYPLVFSDTGAFLAQTIEAWPIWDKPFVYGPALHAFHWRVSLWLPLLAQGLALSWLLALVARVLDAAWWHLPLCLGLVAWTAAPWFAALLIPDWLAPALVLAGFLLGWAGPALSRAERLGVAALATLAAASHLSHLPLAVALAALALLLRGWRAGLAVAAPAALAALLLLATNAAMHGRAALSPFGAVFALARLVADGPAARTIEARCPGAGWQLCRWAGRLPTEADQFLWSRDGPVWAPRTDGAQPGGPISLAPEAAAILAETLRREPAGVLRAVTTNALRQFALVRVGDALVPDNLGPSVARELALGFPAAEQARFAASRQAKGELPEAAAPFLRTHLPALAAGAVLLPVGLWRAVRWRDRRRLGLLLAVLLGLGVNAVVTGGLSGPHHRYQGRLVWLLPLAGVLALLPRRLTRPGAVVQPAS